jgi:glutathione peroxidase
VTLHDVPLTMLDGRATTFGEYAGRAVLVVNVASKCGLTPQYAALETLAETYADRGLTVLGAPCNQFMGQEPGTNEEIAEFCSTTYGVTFPLTDKLEVNGEGRATARSSRASRRRPRPTTPPSSPPSRRH